MTPHPQHKGMEHCKDASVVVKGNGVAWIKCDKIVGDCFWIIKNGKCPHSSPPAAPEPTLNQKITKQMREASALYRAGLKDGRNQTLDNSCRCCLWHFLNGNMKSEDVKTCKGKECNWCGRYNESPRTPSTQEELK